MTTTSAGAPAPLVEVRELVTRFAHPTAESGFVTAVDRVSFDVPRGGAVGLVGESGSGKSVTALSLLRLVRPPGQVAGGRVLLDGVDLLTLPEPELRRVRGDRVSVIFQEPMTALNPVIPVGDQAGEPLVIHRGLSRKQARLEAVELFRKVGIADPDRRVREYPHQMSGGMRQRVMIAMALACRPSLVIADEPTTALDVTIQAQILAVMDELRRELGMALLLITHDLGVVAETCDAVVVLYAGQVVERAPTQALFAAPRHPYTAGLLRSIPARAVAATRTAGEGPRDRRLPEIPGVVPPLDHLPSGCRFQDRCPRVEARCRTETPPLVENGPQAVRCFFPLAPGEAA